LNKRESFFLEPKNEKHWKNCFSGTPPLILSLGGGTPCYYDTMEYLKGFDKLKTFYLQTGIGTLSERLEKAKSTRPLLAHLKDLDQIKEFVGKHLFERNPFYLQADYKIVTDHKSVETVALEIQNTLT
jgi:shikimate kinase